MFVAEIADGKDVTASAENITMKNNLMTIKEVAEYLKINHMTVRSAIRSGKLKAYNIGQGDQRSQWRIREEDVEEYMRKGGK